MQYCILIVYLFFAAAANAQTYKTVDEQGNVVYTDIPPNKDAKPLEIPNNLNITPGIKIPKFKLKQKKVTFSYKLIEITSPSNDHTINGLTENLAISLRLFPNLNTQEGHSLQILMDNSVVAEGSRTGLILENLDRGTHTISAQVIDKNKRVLISTAPVIVHIRKPSALNNL